MPIARAPCTPALALPPAIHASCNPAVWSASTSSGAEGPCREPNYRTAAAHLAEVAEVHGYAAGLCPEVTAEEAQVEIEIDQGLVQVSQVAETEGTVNITEILDDELVTSYDELMTWLADNEESES